MEYLLYSLFYLLTTWATPIACFKEDLVNFGDACQSRIRVDDSEVPLASQDIHQRSNCVVTVAFLVCNENQPSQSEVHGHFTHQIRQLIVSIKSIALAERYTGNIVRGRNRKQCVDVKLLTNDPEIFEKVEAIVQTWDLKFRNYLKLSYVPAIYRKGGLKMYFFTIREGEEGGIIFISSGHEWMSKETQRCAGMRLFLDQILLDTDSIIYVATDMVFLKSVQHLWAEFDKFKEDTVAAMTTELFQKGNISYYHPNSYNSGIMLMNLTRMRHIEWTERLGMLSKLLLRKGVVGDQAILNEYFKHFPKQLQKLPCHWNFVPTYCKFANKCARDAITGVHGFNHTCHDRQKGRESFQTFFHAFETLDLGEHFLLDDFITSVKAKMLMRSPTRNSYDASQTFGKLVIKAVERFKIFVEAPLENRLEIGGECNGQHTSQPPPPLRKRINNKGTKTHSNECVPVGLTFCEPPLTQAGVPSRQFNQTVVLLKSLVLMENLTPNPKCINSIILSDKIESFNGLVRYIKETWDSSYRDLLQFTYAPVSYSKDFAWMKTIFKRCATLRLNYAELLPEYDSVIHLDTDMVFIRPISELWAEFDHFSEETLMMMSPRLQTRRFERWSKKYYWPTKFQSGVILMNLKRMRSIGFPTRINLIATLFRRELILPVQVALSIYFHEFPKEISLLECGWSFLPYYCSNELQPRCPTISAIHGVNSTFGPTTFEPVYRKIFGHYQNTDMKNPVASSLLEKLRDNLKIEFSDIGRKINSQSACASNIFRSRFMERLKKIAVGQRNPSTKIL